MKIINFTADNLLERMHSLEIPFDYTSITNDALSNGPNKFVSGNPADPYEVELGFIPDNQVWIQLKFHTTDDLNNEIQNDLYEKRFYYFELLENVLWTCYQEYQNNDPCSFDYSVDTDHLGDFIAFKVTCTDYFS